MPEARAPQVPVQDVAGLHGVDALGVDSVALFALQGPGPLGGVGDLIDWRLMGRVGQAQARGQFSGGADEQMLLPAPERMGAVRVFVFGLGPKDQLTAERLAGRLRGAVTAVAQAGSRRLALVLPADVGPHLSRADAEAHFLSARTTTNGHIIAKVLRHRVD